MSWWLRVYVAPGTKDDTLACWETGSARWLTELVEAGKLQQVKTGGYPSVYQGAAGDLLPMLHGLEQRHPGELFTKHLERIDGCHPDQELVVALWDQS